MKKLKVYEIQAIAETVVAKLKEVNKPKLPAALQKQMDADNKRLKVLRDQQQKIENEIESIASKYDKHPEISSGFIRYHSDQYLKVNEFKAEGGLYSKIRNEIVISSLSNENVNDMIDSLVKKFTIR